MDVKLLAIKLPKEIIPSWFKIKDETNPKEKKSLIQIYSGEIP